MSKVEVNPLFTLEALPNFDRIRAEEIESGIRQLIKELEENASELEASLTPTWDGLVARLNDISEPLTYAWSIVTHLHSVKNSPEMRTVYETLQPEVVQISLRLSQSEPIYGGLKALRDGPQWNRLELAQKRTVEIAIRDAELAGVGLQGEARNRFGEIVTEIRALGTRFSNNILDFTKSYGMTLTKNEEIEGLPESLLAMAAKAAADAAADDGKEPPAHDPKKGPWRITLDVPLFLPFLKHSRRRDLRERLYRAYVTRATEGEFDNRPHIQRILQLRKELAGLLEFSTYAEVSLSKKMAREVDAVDRLLAELQESALPAARREIDEMTQLAREQTEDEDLELMNWDVQFWAERLRERKYEIEEEKLRPFFPLPRVLEGLFEIVEKVFGVSIKPADGEAQVWHPDVKYFKVFGDAGKELASFFVDPYIRPGEKQQGAWMNSFLQRKRRDDGSIRLPAAYLICNQTPPVDGKPSLMRFAEAVTLFHEFGHGIQHMLTEVDFPEVSGLEGIEWDAIEICSQFMENWCYHETTLLRMARHFETGEPLPAEEFRKIRAARIHLQGVLTAVQVHYGLIDIELHHRFDPEGGETPWERNRKLAERNLPMPLLPEDNFLCSFSHIFAGSYPAGYFSYHWAAVMAADAFSAFEEAGLEDEKAVAEVGKRFRETFLALGGGRHPMEVFKQFRGREPSTQALLRELGLTG